MTPSMPADSVSDPTRATTAPAFLERIALAIELLPTIQDGRFIGRDGAAAQMRADAAGIVRGHVRCRHCGTWGPEGEDHTCLCPDHDNDCDKHGFDDYADVAIAARREIANAT